MNARLTKEAKSLLPAFGAIAAAVLLLACLLTGDEAPGIVMFVFAGGCALMGAAVFGNEFQARTMPLLLSQPLPRGRLWFEKMLVLGIALALTFGVAVAAITLIEVRKSGDPVDCRAFVGGAFLIVLIAFCTAPGLTLGYKNTLLTMVVTLVFPPGLAMTLAALAALGGKILGRPDLLFAAQFDRHPYPFIVIGVLIYSASLYWYGHRGFLRFQAIETHGKELGLPETLSALLNPRLNRLLPGYSSPVSSLIRKELLLHKASFMVSGVMLLLAPCAWVIMRTHPSDLTTTLLVVTFVVPVTLVPFLTGASVMAEERNWGTLAWQLTLPIPPRKQWFIKMAVACLTCLVLGIVLPATMAELGYLAERGYIWVIGPDAGPIDLILGSDAPRIHIMWFIVYLLAFGMLLFGSSVSTNSMRAIIFGIGMLIASGILIALIAQAIRSLNWVGIIDARAIHDSLIRHQADIFAYGDVFELLIILVCGIIVAVFLGLVASFTYTNFRNGDIDPRRKQRQIMTILIFVGVLSAVVSAGMVIVSEVNSVDPDPGLYSTPPLRVHAHPKPPTQVLPH